MRELSLHILDLVQNSLAAGAKEVQLELHENQNGYFVFKIKDDGCGMSEEMVAKVRDPFVTTRKTRKVGMGIPFMDMVTQQCGGHFDIFSTPGKGTEVAAYFEADHLDRPPLGDLIGSFRIMLVGAPEVDFVLTYSCPGGSFCFMTSDVREALGETCDFTNPMVYEWVEDYLQQEMERIHSAQTVQ